MYLNISSEDEVMLLLLSVEILLAVGIPSDLHGPRDPPPALGVHAPAEPRLSVQGRLALKGRDAGSEQPAQWGDAEPPTPCTAQRAGVGSSGRGCHPLAAMTAATANPNGD